MIYHGYTAAGKGENRQECSHYSDGVVVKHGRNVFGGKLVGRVADEKTCLAHGTVTDDNTSRRDFVSYYRGSTVRGLIRYVLYGCDHHVGRRDAM